MTPRLPVADTMRIGVGAEIMISFVASSPSISGIVTSIVMRSGVSRTA